MPTAQSEKSHANVTACDRAFLQEKRASSITAELSGRHTSENYFVDRSECKAENARVDRKLITAEQIEANCPSRLQNIAEEIQKRVANAQSLYHEVEEDFEAIQVLLAEAREVCDEDGFKAFRERFFPNLRKSRIYELFSVAKNKTSIGDIRAKTRERVAKHRANKATAPSSVTVTEKMDQPAPHSPIEHDGPETSASVPEPTQAPAKRRNAVAPGDEALVQFTVLVTELIRRTEKRKPDRFFRTAVAAVDVARLGKFLTGLADLKNSREVQPGPMMVSATSYTAPNDQTEHLKRTEEECTVGTKAGTAP